MSILRLCGNEVEVGCARCQDGGRRIVKIPDLSVYVMKKTRLVVVFPKCPGCGGVMFSVTGAGPGRAAHLKAMVAKRAVSFGKLINDTTKQEANAILVSMDEQYVAMGVEERIAQFRSMDADFSLKEEEK